jgi:hypothetical protein
MRSLNGIGAHPVVVGEQSIREPVIRRIVWVVLLPVMVVVLLPVWLLLLLLITPVIWALPEMSVP